MNGDVILVGKFVQMVYENMMSPYYIIGQIAKSSF